MNDLLLNVIHFVISFAFALFFLLNAAMVLVYLERKVMALMQDRVGPLHNGPQGLLQSPLDVAKLLLKEDVRSGHSKDSIVFRLAPMIFFAPVITAFVVLPFSPYLTASALGTAQRSLKLCESGLKRVTARVPSRRTRT